MINIYPLETLSLLPRKEPKQTPAEAKSILDYVSVKRESDQRLATLVHNIFYKVVMVRDYPTAMRYARDHKLTCVTPDQQVVYSGAFITKVGSSRGGGGSTQENRVTLLLKISSL